MLRRQSTVNATTTDFLLDGQNVVAEKQAGAISAVYLTGASGPLYRRDSSADVHWYVFDGLGSVVVPLIGIGYRGNAIRGRAVHDPTRIAALGLGKLHDIPEHELFEQGGGRTNGLVGNVRQAKKLMVVRYKPRQ